MIYLASPYSHPDPEVREDRFKLIAKVAGKLMQSGIVLFCPITHSHPIHLYSNMPEDFDYIAFDNHFMCNCKELWVICIDGWDKSIGIQKEIEYFKNANRPIKLITLNQIFPEGAPKCP